VKRTETNFWILVVFTLLLASCSGKLLVSGGASAKASKGPVNIYRNYNPLAVSHFIDGTFYYLKGDFAMAALEFMDALRYDSTSATIYLALARAYINLGKVENGIKNVRKSLEIDPENREAIEILARFYEVSDNPIRAEKEYERLLKIDPKDIELLYTLGRVYIRNKKFDKALKAYEKIVELDSTQAKAIEKAAELSLLDSALAKSARYFGMLLKLDPGNLRYTQALARVMYFMKDYDSCFVLYKGLIENNPDNPELKEDFAELLLNIPEDRYKSYAEEYMEDLLKEYRDRKNPYIIYALYLFRNGRNKECLAFLDSAINRFPNEIEFYLIKGNVYDRLKDYETEAEILLKALEVGPHSVRARHMLAVVWDRLKEYEKCDSLYEELLLENPDDHLALNNYAYSLAVRGEKLQKAYEMVERALKLDPGNPSYLDTKGWILFKLGRYREALQYVEAAYKKAKENAEVLEHLGDIYMRLKKKKKAFYFYKKALEIGPENRSVREKLEK